MTADVYAVPHGRGVSGGHGADGSAMSLTAPTADACTDCVSLRVMSMSSSKLAKDRDMVRAPTIAPQGAVSRPPEDGTGVESVSHLRDPE
jgi:hypothetical protein